ncbi:MAG TPA: Fic family protein [bacterium]|nr:Fic family protein [bacterium]
MTTLNQFLKESFSIPASTNWYIADISQAIGKQELFTKQSPQKLKVLKEHSVIESAVSSNRIEGITIDKSRINEVIFGKALLKDRDEEEIRGYRDALNLIHNKAGSIKLTDKTILDFHKLIRRDIWDAGKYKDKNVDIIEKYPDGSERIRFNPVSFKETPKAINELVKLYNQILKEKTVHPLLLLAGFNLDFLCVHPFRDGNGRVSRLLLLLSCYHLGMEVGRYISLERLIEQNKERYWLLLKYF